MWEVSFYFDCSTALKGSSAEPSDISVTDTHDRDFMICYRAYLHQALVLPRLAGVAVSSGGEGIKQLTINSMICMIVPFPLSVLMHLTGFSPPKNLIFRWICSWNMSCLVQYSAEMFCSCEVKTDIHSYKIVVCVDFSP